MHAPKIQNSAVSDGDRGSGADAAEKGDGTIREPPREASFSTAMLFTAAEIASALGKVSKQAVILRLSGIPADGHKTVRGQKNVRAWRVESLPASLFAELERLCTFPDGTPRYHTVSDLIAKIPAAHTRELCVKDFPEDEQKKAEQKAQLLGPILSERARKRTLLAACARRAREAFAVTQRKEPPALRTIEEWMKEAERRDKGRCAFNRVELYLPETAPRRGRENAEAAAIFLPSLEAFIRECSIPLPKENQPLLWHAAFTDAETEIARGLPEAAVRSAAIERLAHPESPLYPKSAAALLRTWSLKFALWKDLDRTPESIADLRQKNKGRPAKFDLSPDERYALRCLHLEKGSVDNAIKFFVNDPACLPATRELILAEMDRKARSKRRLKWSDSIRRAAHVSKEETAAHRGPKATQSIEMFERRGAFYLDESGNKCQMAPNRIWESDDMSSNEPCHFVDPETGITRGGRQILFTQDVHSAAWLGCTALGRERDAYRVEDIADHMLAVVDVHGLPSRTSRERLPYFQRGPQYAQPGRPAVWGTDNP